jgi:HEAT repeat protein
MLNSDTSPRARDAAARALGLIAAPQSLNALQTAAQADDDREVRQSARFAAEVIRGNLRR